MNDFFRWEHPLLSFLLGAPKEGSGPHCTCQQMLSRRVRSLERTPYLSWTLWLWPSLASTEPFHLPFPNYPEYFQESSVLLCCVSNVGYLFHPRAWAIWVCQGQSLLCLESYKTSCFSQAIASLTRHFQRAGLLGPLFLKVHQTASLDFSWDSHPPGASFL